MEPPGAQQAIPGMTITDAELIRRSQRDPESFGRVFDRHVAAVHAFAQRRIGHDLAGEVTAETFARGFEARSRSEKRPEASVV